jgi:hypothetical protein
MDITAQEQTKARALAQDWVRQGIDLNEAGKMLAYLRSTHNWRGCLELMQRLATTGTVRSQQTRRYYKGLREACLRHVGEGTDADEAERIMGWAFRLGRYESIKSAPVAQRGRP